MTANWRLPLFSACGALLLALAVALPATRGTAADADPAPALTYDLSGTLTLADPGDRPVIAEAQDADVAVDADELECMAKVVMHEAGNQPRIGQVAVAQTLVNRQRSGRFPPTICAVANQPGQYFPTASYRPTRDARWQSAVAVARDTLLGNTDPAAPGALYFNGTGARRTSFFAGRVHVATIGDHHFYR